MIACRPLLLSQTTPLIRPSFDDRPAEPAVQAQVDLRLGDHRVGDALEAVGIERGGVADRLRLDVRVKSNTPQRDHLRHNALVGAALGLRRHVTQSPIRSIRSIISPQRPRTVISAPLHMSSSTSTMPPEASPPR